MLKEEIKSGGFNNTFIQIFLYSLWFIEGQIWFGFVNVQFLIKERVIKREWDTHTTNQMKTFNKFKIRHNLLLNINIKQKERNYFARCFYISIEIHLTNCVLCILFYLLKVLLTFICTFDFYFRWNLSLAWVSIYLFFPEGYQFYFLFSLLERKSIAII